MSGLSVDPAGAASGRAGGGGPDGSTLETVVVDHLAALEGLRAGWDALAVANRLPYCAPDWMLAWWRAAERPGASLRALAALEGDRLVGIAPFYVSRRRGGPARYSLLAAAASPRIEPLAARGRVDEVAAAFASALAGLDPAPDLIAFDGIPASSPWPALLARSWPAHRPTRVSVERSRPAPTAALRDLTFDGWLAAKSRNFRGQMRRAQRDLDGRGGRFRISGPDEVERDLEAFARLHHARWDPKGGSSALTPEVERMLPDAARELASGERFRLWCMDIGGEVVCAHLHLVAGGEVAWWLGGFDDAWASIHPSLQALATAIEDGMRRGEDRFDLGSGAQPFKYRFADAEDRLDWIRLYPPSGRRPLTLAAQAPAAVRRRISARLSKRLKERLRPAAARLPR